MKSKIIGINLLFLIPGKVGGTESYSRRLLTALVKHDKKNRYLLICNKENYSTFNSNFEKVLVPINATNRPVRLITEQILLPMYLIWKKVDLLYSLGYISPFFTHCRSVVNIFDLNWYYFPEDFSLLQRIFWKFFVTNSARFSDAITTSSYSSKKSIQKVLKVRKKIEVIYSGLPKITTTKSELDDTKNNVPYFFTLSAAYPHKNLITLLKAFKEVHSKGYIAKLLIAGLGGRSSGEIGRYIKENKLGSSVKLLGYVSDSKISALYKNCLCFVFTSAYEGFGIPIVESFSLGVPVISSDAFSLKEVIGNGGVLVNPYDYKRFFSEMEKVLIDNSYRKELIIKSKNEAKRFNWVLSIKKLISFFDIVVTF